MLLGGHLVDVLVHPLPVELVTVGINVSVHIRFLEFLGSSSQMKRDYFRLPWWMAWIVCDLHLPSRLISLIVASRFVRGGEMILVNKIH